MSESRYTKDHEWVRLDGDIAVVGISNHAQEALGDVVFVELPEPGRVVDEGPPHELFRAPSHPRTQAFLRAVVDRQVMSEQASP